MIPVPSLCIVLKGNFVDFEMQYLKHSLADKSRILKYFVKICYASETEETIRLLLRDLNVVHRQIGGTADDLSSRQNVTLGRRPDMTPVDFCQGFSASAFPAK